MQDLGLDPRAPAGPSERAEPIAPTERIVPTGLTALSAIEIADLVIGGELSAEEVTRAHLSRIAECDPSVRAMVSVDDEGALRAARRVDRSRKAGRPLGPLAGIPVVVKDNLDVRRQVSSCGSHAHSGVLAYRHAVAVSRMLAHDAILLGRANMDEMGLGASTQSSAFGPTRNPLDLRRSPGGSSGGSAAAVAAGLAALALGSDTGGSIREPAAQCGVVGMAPSRGLVPVAGLVPFDPALDRVGPLGRTCADVALLLATLSARPDLAPVADPRPGQLRVGVVAEFCGDRNSPQVLARLEAALAALAEAGVQLVTVSLPDAPRALDAYFTMTSVTCVSTLAGAVATGRAGAELARRYELGRLLLAGPGDRLAWARTIQRRLIHEVRAALTECDVLLSPTLPTTAPLLDGSPAEAARQLDDPMAAPYTDCWTVLANLTGLTALSVPAGCSAQDGMPVGVMLSAASGADADVLGLGAVLERVLNSAYCEPS